LKIEVNELKVNLKEQKKLLENEMNKSILEQTSFEVGTN
jgi:sulfur carrier protein ThiS